jgi:hypothetical protein
VVEAVELELLELELPTVVAVVAAGLQPLEAFLFLFIKLGVQVGQGRLALVLELLVLLVIKAHLGVVVAEQVLQQLDYKLLQQRLVVGD